jgi:hypothetical protein
MKAMYVYAYTANANTIVEYWMFANGAWFRQVGGIQQNSK